MYQVMLVDDERFIVEGLKVLIDWRHYGFEICAAVSDSRVALETAAGTHLDVVITDINMPFINGLDLLGRLQKMQPQLKSIVLSGYRDFEYAQEAIEKAARAYLLKPVNEAELLARLENIKVELDRTAQMETMNQNLYCLLEKSMPALRHQYLNDLIFGKLKTAQEISAHFELLGIKSSAITEFMLAVGVTDRITDQYEDDRMEQQLLLSTVQKIMATIEPEQGLNVVCDDHYGRVVILLLNYGASDFKSSCLGMLNQMIQNIWKDCNLQMYVGVSSTYQDLTCLNLIYQESLKALQFRLTRKAEGVLCYERVTANPENWCLPTQTENELFSEIELGNLPNALVKLEELLAYFDQSSLSPDLIYLSCANLVANVTELLANSGGGAVPFLGDQYFSVTTITQLTSLAQLHHYLETVIQQAIALINERHKLKQNRFIVAIKQYVAAHYMENITLETLAHQFYLNTSYLCRLFKKELGITFVDYLTGIRMRQAQKLLSESNLRVYEVAQQVGYSNQRYFSELFERIVGCKPNEYKKRLD